jgi:mannose-6-phosphate isomerase-like protein (cupin superfamily)
MPKDIAVDFDDKASLRLTRTIRVDAGDRSQIKTVVTDCDYVLFVAGVGMIESRGVRTDVDAGSGVVVRKGDQYALNATGMEPLIAVVYEFDGTVTPLRSTES